MRAIRLEGWEKFKRGVNNDAYPFLDRNGPKAGTDRIRQICVCQHEHASCILELPVPICIRPLVVLPSFISCFALVRLENDSNTTGSQKTIWLSNEAFFLDFDRTLSHFERKIGPGWFFLLFTPGGSTRGQRILILIVLVLSLVVETFFWRFHFFCISLGQTTLERESPIQVPTKLTTAWLQWLYENW